MTSWWDLRDEQSWWQLFDDSPVSTPTMDVYVSTLAQPIGFVWLSKPRYRVKAGSRKV